MPFLDVNDLRIHYLDSETDSPETILFIHGNSHSLRTFRHQLGDGRLRERRLIALDLPGHGRSSTSQAYGMPLFVKVLKDFCRELSLSRVVLVGHSLGGHIALEAAAEIGAEGVFVFGTPPLSKPLDMSAFKPHPTLGSLFKNSLSLEETLDLLGAMYENRKITLEDTEEFLRTDFQFRELLSGSFGRGEYEDEVELLKCYQGKALVLASDRDQFISGDYIHAKLDPRNVACLDLSHNGHVEEPEKLNSLLLSFLDEAFAEAPVIKDADALRA